MAEGVLGDIVRRKRVEIGSRLDGATLDPQPTHRSLRSAIAQHGARFIMEVKKASPSGHRSNVTVDEAVGAYAPVADAISVLTDESFFHGSLADLRTVRARFDGPILAKDFIIDPRQVTEARLHGADAVLAILAALDDTEVPDIAAEARRLGMDVIFEVHDERELQRAIGLGAAIIGINNRDLATLTTDLTVTDRLAARVPQDRVIISESGISTRRDAERYSAKVDAFLVGSALMAASDITFAARNLVHGTVKICGLTDIRDVDLAAKSGATHAGLIFVEGSPRRIDGQAAELAARARDRGLRPVGVFRDQPIATIANMASSLKLGAVQLHGSELALHQLRKDLPGDCELWAVSGVRDRAEPARPGADRTVFDTIAGGQCGGTGHRFDWGLIADRPDLPSAFLAGGIGPANARAAQSVGAFGIDLCSAVESAPGRKDQYKLDALFTALRPSSRSDLQCA